MFDLVLGEPPAPLHPVVWIGAGIDRLEQRAPSPASREALAYGAVASLAMVGLSAGTALAAERFLQRLRAPIRLLATGLLLNPSFSLRMLLGEARAARRSLRAGRLDLARSQLRALVSRDTSALAESECAAAAVESLAENLTDSVIAPWLGFLAAGLPGAWFVRAVNTLDSRWGYHGRYELLGRFAARLDDAVMWVPARLSAILLIVAAPFGGGRSWEACRVLLRDHSQTASPNAGWTMAAMAGALERRLEKRDQYVLNADGRACDPNDIRRAERVVSGAALLGLLAGGVLEGLPQAIAGPGTKHYFPEWLNEDDLP